MNASVYRRESSVKLPNTSRLAPVLRAAVFLFLVNLVVLPAFAWQNDEESAPAQENKAIP